MTGGHPEFLLGLFEEAEVGIAITTTAAATTTTIKSRGHDVGGAAGSGLVWLNWVELGAVVGFARGVVRSKLRDDGDQQRCAKEKESKGKGCRCWSGGLTVSWTVSGDGDGACLAMTRR